MNTRTERMHEKAYEMFLLLSGCPFNHTILSDPYISKEDQEANWKKRAAELEFYVMTGAPHKTERTT